MARPSDVVHRFGAGDPAAVRELYRSFSRPVFTIAFRSLRDRGLAEEAVQQTFLQAWRGASGFEAGRDPAPWLYAIARRVAIDIHRRERRHVHFDEVPEVAVIPPEFERSWEAWQVRTAIDSLPDEEKDVLRCTYYAGMTHEETASHLDIPVGTVKSRSHRSHRRLAQLLTHLEEASA